MVIFRKPILLGEFLSNRCTSLHHLNDGQLNHLYTLTLHRRDSVSKTGNWASRRYSYPRHVLLDQYITEHDRAVFLSCSFLPPRSTWVKSPTPTHSLFKNLCTFCFLVPRLLSARTTFRRLPEVGTHEQCNIDIHGEPKMRARELLI